MQAGTRVTVSPVRFPCGMPPLALHLPRRGFTLDVDDGVMHLRGELREAGVAFDLELGATSFPSLATDVRVGASGSFNWLVVPALVATGSATIGGARRPAVVSPVQRLAWVS